LVVDIVGRDHCELISADDKLVVVRTKNAGTSSGIVTDLFEGNLAGIGDLYLAAGYPAGVRLGKLGQLFAIAYVLGMLVRYYPTIWMDLIHQRIGHAAIPTISKAIDILETLYPRIIVDFLEE
jgi:hypothetical protein